MGLKKHRFFSTVPFPLLYTIFDKKGTPFKYAEPLLPLCFLIHISKTGLLIFRRKKGKISRDFQGQIRRKIGRFRGIFAGKKIKIRGTIGRFRAIFTGEESKFAEKSAHFENRPISREISGGNFAKKQSVKNSRFRWGFFWQISLELINFASI